MASLQPYDILLPLWNACREEIGFLFKEVKKVSEMTA